MTLNKILKTFSAVSLICLSSCSNKQILNEQFDDNKLGWVEERTNYHRTDIRYGKYLIQSIDSSKSRSSTGSKSDSYLVNLPEKYEITTSFEFNETNGNLCNAGIILVSPTLEYQFGVYSDGSVGVTEYDCNSDSTITLVWQTADLNREQPVDLAIEIKGMHFDLAVNNRILAEGNFRTETSSWRDLRLYTSTQSTTIFDYLKIK